MRLVHNLLHQKVANSLRELARNQPSRVAA